MTVTFAEKLARIPGYQAGVPTGQAPEAIAAGGIAQLASNESSFPPHPQVVEAIQAAAGAMNRYPDPDATLLRRRLAERYETEPGRVAVGNGSCEILLAAAEALCEPGAEIVYAWPSFSMYPYLAALTGAREIRVPLAEGEVHDLDAMAAEVTAATQLVIVCNPNNPTGTHIPAAEVAAFCERVPSHVTIVLDEAYVEFQTDDDPDATVDLLGRVPQPGRPAHLQQGLRPGRAAGRLRARLGQVPRRGRRGAPAVQRQRPRPGGGRRGGPAPGRRRAPGRADDRRAAAGRGGAARARPRHRRDPGQLLLDRPRRRRGARGRRRPRRAPDRRPSRHARSATPATSASATAPRPRTTASSRRSASCSTNHASPATKSAVKKRTGKTASQLAPPAPRSSLPASPIYWRFS